MSTKHTPGPWTAHGPATKGNQWGVVADLAYDARRGARRRIALLGSPRSWDGLSVQAEDEANAQLIAAAPDMLAALKLLLSLIEYTQMPAGETTAKAKAAAYAAIAKATGEQS
jgi:hypothetical protein